MKNLRITVNGTAYDVQVEELAELERAVLERVGIEHTGGRAQHGADEDQLDRVPERAENGQIFAEHELIGIQRDILGKDAVAVDDQGHLVRQRRGDDDDVRQNEDRREQDERDDVAYVEDLLSSASGAYHRLTSPQRLIVRLAHNPVSADH